MNYNISAIAQLPGLKLFQGIENTTFKYNASGQVTHVGEVERNGRIDYDKVDRDEVYQVRDQFVLEQEFGKRGAEEWTLFHDADKDGIWSKVAAGRGSVELDSLIAQMTDTGPILPPTSANPTPETSTTPKYELRQRSEDTVFKFNARGEVTHVGEIERNGRIDYDKVDRDEVYQVRGQFVLEQEFGKRGAEEWKLFHDADQDGLWAEAARGYGPVAFDTLIAHVSNDFAFA